jgi:molecular chaperone GrpE
MQRAIRSGIRGSRSSLNRGLFSPKVVSPPSKLNNINNLAFQMANARCFTSTRVVNAEAAEKKEEEEVPGAEEAAEAGGEVEDESATKIAALEKEVKDLKDQILRSLAEEENVRRIARKDVENANTYAITKFAKALLDVSDNFERALGAIPEDTKKSLEAGEGDPLFKSFVEGIAAVDKEMLKTFSSFGVTKFGKAGEKFDPEMHDALFNIPDGSKEENTIGQVVKKGFKLKGRVLRAAQCGVVVKA